MRRGGYVTRNDSTPSWLLKCSITRAKVWGFIIVKVTHCQPLNANLPFPIPQLQEGQ